MGKCIKKNKYCKSSICFLTPNKKNYICSGVSFKPTKFSEDKVWLCLKGKLSKTALEMTKNETLGIISVLTASLFAFEELLEEITNKKRIYNDDDRVKIPVKSQK